MLSRAMTIGWSLIDHIMILGGPHVILMSKSFIRYKIQKKREFGKDYHLLREWNFYWGKQSIKLSKEEERKYPILRQSEINQTKNNNNNNNNNNSFEAEEEQEQKMEEDRI